MLTWLSQCLPDLPLALGVVAVFVGIVWFAECAERQPQPEQPRPPITEAEVEQHGAAAVDELEAYSNEGYAAATPYRLRASVLDDVAARNPMPKRPGPPPVAPGEPWQLQVKNDTLGPRLVEQPAEPEINSGGEL